MFFIIWAIWYGPLHMKHIIRSISYGLYYIDYIVSMFNSFYFIFVILYESYNMTNFYDPSYSVYCHDAFYMIISHVPYKYIYFIRTIWYGPLHIIKILNNPNHGLRLAGNWGVSFVSFWKVESQFHIFWFSLYWQRNAKWYIGGLGMIPFLAHSVIKCIIRRTQIEISHSNSDDIPQHEMIYWHYTHSTRQATFLISSPPWFIVFNLK